MRLLLSFVLGFSLALVACGGTDEPGAGPDAGAVGPDAEPGPDPTDALYDPTHIVEVSIEMAEDDWDALRYQSRSINLLVGDGCQDQPFAKPYTYFPAQVKVDDVTVAQAGVRKKGFFGSADTEKPSIKVKFDEYVPDLEVYGSSRLTLNNNKQDPAFIKQCLGYQIFAAAGIPAPRCNFAHVTLNGRDLGLFANVEPVKKPMLRRHFADDEGNLYEGTLSDFRAGWTGTFEKKTNEMVAAQPEIEALTTALQASDAALLGELGASMDVDAFINFWATEVLIAHWDGYANNNNNFFLYGDPSTGKTTFMPWGIDGILADANPFPDGEAPPKAVFATGLLARRLYLLPETRDKYLTRLEQLLDTVWDETSLLAEIDRMETLVIDIAKNDPFSANVDVADEIELVRQFVRDRRAMLAPELATPRTWDYALRETFCFPELGTISGNFATTWGDIGRDPFAAGTGILNATVDGTPWPTQTTGSKAGLNTDNEQGPRAQVQVVSVLQNGNVAVFAVDVIPDQFVPGTLAIDFTTVGGFLLEWDTTTQMARVVGVITSGTLQLDMAGMTNGAPVSGSFTGNLVKLFF
jgi:hypothetical protein